MLKLYVGLAFAGMVFMFKNLSMRSFLQNTVKAMESEGNEEKDNSLEKESAKQELNEPSGNNEGTTEGFTDKSLEQEKSLDSNKHFMGLNKQNLVLITFFKQKLDTPTPVFTGEFDLKPVPHAKICDAARSIIYFIELSSKKARGDVDSVSLGKKLGDLSEIKGNELRYRGNKFLTDFNSCVFNIFRDVCALEEIEHMGKDKKDKEDVLELHLIGERFRHLISKHKKEYNDTVVKKVFNLLKKPGVSNLEKTKDKEYLEDFCRRTRRLLNTLNKLTNTVKEATNIVRDGKICFSDEGFKYYNDIFDMLRLYLIGWGLAFENILEKIETAAGIDSKQKGAGAENSYDKSINKNIELLSEIVMGFRIFVSTGGAHTKRYAATFNELIQPKNVEESKKLGLVYLKDLQLACANIKDFIKNLYEKDKVGIPSSEEYNLYSKLYDTIEEIANLEKDEKSKADVKHAISEFIYEYNDFIDKFIKTYSVGIARGDKPQKIKPDLNPPDKEAICKFFEKSYFLSEKMENLIKELPCSDEIIGKGFSKELIEDFEKVFDYVLNWKVDIKNILSDIYKGFRFVNLPTTVTEFSKDQINSGIIKRSPEYLKEFFNKKLGEPDKHFTGLDECYFVPREVVSSMYEREIKPMHEYLCGMEKQYGNYAGPECDPDGFYKYAAIKGELRAYNKMKKVLNFDVSTISKKCIISKFREKYNSMLETLKKDKKDLNPKEKEDVEALVKEVRELLDWELYSCRIRVADIKPETTSNYYEYSDIKPPAYYENYNLAEQCAMINRYLYFWYLTIDNIRDVLDEKFIYDDASYKEVNKIFEKKLIGFNECLKNKEDDVLIPEKSDSKRGFMHDKLEEYYSTIKNEGSLLSLEDINSMYGNIESYHEKVKLAIKKNKKAREGSGKPTFMMTFEEYYKYPIGNEYLAEICETIEELNKDSNFLESITDFEGKYENMRQILQKPRYSITYAEKRDIFNIYNLIFACELELGSAERSLFRTIEDIAEGESEYTKDRSWDVKYSRFGKDDFEILKGILIPAIEIIATSRHLVPNLTEVRKSIENKFPFVIYDKDKNNILEGNKRCT